MISHNLEQSFLKRFDSIIFMENGKIIATEEYELLLNNCDNFYDYLIHVHIMEVIFMGTILKACNLGKSYGEQEVLTNINFDIQSGDIVRLIGKNGCGKTTLMKMILGFTSLTKGDIQFEGDSNYYTKREALNKIGFLLDCKLFEDFSAYDNLKLFSMYSSVSNKKNLDERIDKLLTFVGLENSKKPVKSYSFGMKQRLGLALALLDDPEFLILDEPFVGLDPRS